MTTPAIGYYKWNGVEFIIEPDTTNPGPTGSIGIQGATGSMGIPGNPSGVYHVNMPNSSVGNYTVKKSDYFVPATYNSVITLPNSPTHGWELLIKDIGGSASLGSNIIINTGAGDQFQNTLTQYIIDIDYGWVRLLYMVNTYYIIGKY